jgi:hypothetical protein
MKGVMVRTATAFGLVLTIALAGGQTRSTSAAPDLEAIYRQFIDAQNRGEVNAAFGLFASDAESRGGAGCPTANPCAGPQGIRWRIQGAVADHITVDVTNVEVSGVRLTARTLMRTDTIQAAGLVRIVIPRHHRL